LAIPVGKGEIIQALLGESSLKTLEFADLTICHNETLLFRLSDFQSSSFDPNSTSEDMKQILTRSGVLDAEIEFRPNRDFKSKFSDKDNSLPTPFRIRGLRDWLRRLCENTSETFYLIPDTNVLINCYYSNFIKPAIAENRHHLQFILPRIVTLELERRVSSYEYSRSLEFDEMVTKLKSAIDNIQKLIEEQFKKAKDGQYESAGARILEKKLTTEKQKVESVDRGLKRKRLSFVGLNELYSMLLDGAQTMSNLEYPSLYLKNNGLPDSLIRMEIAHNLGNSSPSNHIFLSTDFASSQAGSAENLNSMYFHHLSSVTDKTMQGFENIMYNSAIQFNDCDITIQSKNVKRTMRLIGMWEGKNQSDWSANSVQYEFMK
jgi:hypothetical protein